jgi:hypothetical protein
MTMGNVDWTMVGAIGQLLAAAVTALGLLFVARQIREAGKVANADFVLRVEEGFNGPLTATYQKLIPGAPWAPDQPGPSTHAEVSELEKYVDYFTTLQVLRTQGLIDLDTIDSMFAFRFFIAVNNPHTRRVLEPNKGYWEFLYKLYDDWVAFRKSKNKPVPQEQHRLS